MDAGSSTASAEWRAHWPKVVAGTVGMSFYAMLTYHFGLFIQPLEAEFGWTRGNISLGLTIYSMGAVLLGPLMGGLIDHIGTRMIALVSLVLTAASLAALSFANGSIVQWYLLWCLIACTALGTKSTTWSAAISSLFTAGRGLALAVVLSGTAIAQSLAPLAANALIAERGWREAYQWLGLGWGAIPFVLVLFLFFDAHDQKRGATAAHAAPVASLGGLSVKAALKDFRILRIALASLVVSIVGAGVSVHIVPLLSGTGVDRTTAAGMAATAGIAGDAGKLVTGWLLDRFQGNLVPFSSLALAALGYTLLLNLLGSNWALVLGVMILGYTSGAGLQVTAYLIGRYGGLRNFGKIYATIGSMLMLGASIGPFLAGSVYDQTGSYNALLLTAAPVVFLCALMFVGLGPYPDFSESDTAAGKT